MLVASCAMLISAVAFTVSAFAQGADLLAPKAVAPAGSTVRYAAPPAMPARLVAAAPIGSWADYRFSDGMHGASIRWVLVGVESGVVRLEATLRAEQANLGGTPTRMLLVAKVSPHGDAIDAAKEIVVQIGQSRPVRMPEGWTAIQRRFRAPDPKTFVGKEAIAFGQGHIASEHYRESTPAGTVDFWLSDAAPPLGLVRMRLTPAVNPLTSAPARTLQTELVGLGQGAQAEVVGEPAPFGAGRTVSGTR